MDYRSSVRDLSSKPNAELLRRSFRQERNCTLDENTLDVRKAEKKPQYLSSDVSTILREKEAVISSKRRFNRDVISRKYRTSANQEKSQGFMRMRQQRSFM